MKIITNVICNMIRKKQKLLRNRPKQDRSRTMKVVILEPDAVIVLPRAAIFRGPAPCRLTAMMLLGLYQSVPNFWRIYDGWGAISPAHAR